MCGVFFEAFNARDRLIAGPIALVSGACLVAAAGSLFAPSWRGAGIKALAAMGVFYAGLIVLHQLGRLRGADHRRDGDRAPAPGAPRER